MKAKTTSEANAREPFFEVAEDSTGWHWCLWSSNGRPIARNAEPYGTKKDALQAIRTVAPNAGKAKLVAQNHSEVDDQESAE